MKIGISVSSSIAASSPQEAMTWMVQRTRVARVAGLDSLSLGDHHAMSNSYMQNTPTLGRLIAEWPDCPVGCLFLLPLWNPVLVAEHIGTLAAMTDAPFIVQTGIGAGTQQFEVMGAEYSTRGRDLEPAVQRIKQLLSDEAADGAQIAPRPQQPVEW